MAKLITVTEVIRSFSDIVNRVYYKGESFDIKKGINVVARLLPAKDQPSIAVSELNSFFKHLTTVDKKDIEGFERVIKESRMLKIEKGANKWD